MRFHILGTGAIGCHVATELRRRNPVTLLLRSQNHVQEFLDRKNRITYLRLHQQPVEITGFDALNFHDPPEDCTVDALVVATKAQHAVEAIRTVKPMLNRDSTLVLFQNGMGVAEELLSKVWESAKDAPSIVVGVNRHAVERLAPYSIKHNSGWNDPQALALGAMPHSQKDKIKAVIDAFTECPDMRTTVLEWPELRKRMMRKLVINATINPLAGVLDVNNGRILESPEAMELLRGLTEEVAKTLTELECTNDELFDEVVKMAEIAAANNCSTVQDLRAKRKSEIEFINGYIVRLAKERGISVPLNETFLRLIHSKEHAIGAQ